MEKIGCIFDLDGVIVDTAKYHYLAWKKLANELGFQFTERQNERFKGVSRKKSLEILLEIGGVKATPQQFDRWMEEKNNDYLAYIDGMDESEILPRVPWVLEYLKNRQVPIALGSASKNAVSILEKVKLSHYFDVVVDGNQVSRAKPDPEVFLMAAQKMGLAAKNCIVFEDALAGIEAANNAQMTSIGIGDPSVLVAADFVFGSFEEIDGDFLDNLLKSTAK